MEKNLDPWSKRIWYVECLVLFLLIWLFTLNPIAMLTLMVISIIATPIISIYLRITESTDIKPKLPNTFTTPNPSSVQNLEPKYIIIEGMQHRVGSKSLKLSGKHINSITDIQGLDHLWRVRKLDLSHNQITTMRGIEYFPNLRILKLSDNKIQKIENIRNFQKLKKVILDNNQLKEFNITDLPNTATHINIAKNPIEKFHIYTKETYKKIHFGPKQWFPKQELTRIKKIMRRQTYHEINEAGMKILLALVIWAGITLGIASFITLIIILAVTNYHPDPVKLDFWELLFTAEWSAILFIGAGILAAVGMVALYYELS